MLLASPMDQLLTPGLISFTDGLIVSGTPVDQLSYPVIVWPPAVVKQVGQPAVPVVVIVPPVNGAEKVMLVTPLVQPETQLRICVPPIESTHRSLEPPP